MTAFRMRLTVTVEGETPEGLAEEMALHQRGQDCLNETARRLVDLGRIETTLSAEYPARWAPALA